MRLKVTKSKNSKQYYVIKTVYIDGKEKTITVEKLGNHQTLLEKLNGEDPLVWAKKYVEELNSKEKEEAREVITKHSPKKIIKKDKQTSFNGGYLFLQKIYHELGLNKVCSEISDKYKFEYDLNSILSRLIYGRIIYPSSKLNTFKLSKKFMEKPNFDIQHIYRALEVLTKESDSIQSSVYKNSLNISNRNTKVLYYDCTNYFFEIEEAHGLKQYGKSKENKPNPIVQMGLFMDGDGIPLAFNITKGNTNEQITLKPLEEKILTDFKLSKFVICTDAGLSSTENRKFNDIADRAFITTQSIKKLKAYLKEWALNSKGWSTDGSSKTYDISKLDDMMKSMNECDKAKMKSRIFYKERWINDDGLEQKIIITFSIKYRDYQVSIRNSQIDRAKKAISSKSIKLTKKNQNDYKRFAKRISVTDDGEIADKDTYIINEDVIAEEEKYDGFYGVCTNLEATPSEIAKVNKRRWEIEECFRIMKSEFKARPVYLQRDDRIQAHFITCFLALIIFRFLEKKLDEKYTCTEIITALRDMNFYRIEGEGYIPTYTRTDFTDYLHNAFNFRTDYEIVTNKNMKKILKDTKK